VWIGILLAILVSTGLGFLNGLIVTKARIPSFIATLGTLLAYRGIVRAIGQGNFATYKGPTIPIFQVFNGDFTFMDKLFGAPDSFRTSLLWFILIAILFTFFLMRTKFGNWIFAAGGGPEAAGAQGVNVVRVKIICFTLVGFLVAIASIMQFSYRLSVDPLRGDGMELIVVAASVIGGVRMTGGYGTIFGAIVGTMLLQMLDQG
jgi:simple sugar transport system permease protein